MGIVAFPRRPRDAAYKPIININFLSLHLEGIINGFLDLFAFIILFILPSQMLSKY